MNKTQTYLPIIGFLILGIFLWRGLYLDPKELPSMLVDKPLPEFELESVQGTQILNNENLPDQMFLLNVWGSYCLPCLAEHPTLMRLAGEQVIPIVGINYKDRRISALKWLDDNGDPFTHNLMDKDGRFGIDLGVYGAPETFLVDANGVVRYRHVSILDEDVWQDVFVPAIAELEKEEAKL